MRVRSIEYTIRIPGTAPCCTTYVKYDMFDEVEIRKFKIQKSKFHRFGKLTANETVECIKGKITKAQTSTDRRIFVFSEARSAQRTGNGPRMTVGPRLCTTTDRVVSGKG